MIQRIKMLRSNISANYLVVFVRYLIGYAFIPSGLVKVLGERFTLLPVSNPVGYFFDALYKSGIYWNFLGVSQIVAAFLLMTQRFATIGALMFLGIVTNIFLITVGVNFGNTRYVTFLMWLAASLLVLWDWERVRLLFLKPQQIKEVNISQDRISNNWAYLGFFLFLFHVTLSLLNYRGMLGENRILRIIIPFLITVLAVGVTFLIDFKRTKSSGMPDSVNPN